MFVLYLMIFNLHILKKQLKIRLFKINQVIKNIVETHQNHWYHKAVIKHFLQICCHFP